MSKQRLLFPDQALREVEKKFFKHHKSWLSEEPAWVLEISLGDLTQDDVLRDTNLVQQWISAWQQWPGPAELTWRDRRWKNVGSQMLPHKLRFAAPHLVAEAVGQGDRWSRAKQRAELLSIQWPTLNDKLGAYFDVLADYDDIDFERLKQSVIWFSENRDSKLYARQIPISGLDSKWLECRSYVIANLVSTISNGEDALDSFSTLGLRRLPDLGRVRILDPELRSAVGGLKDLMAPVTELQSLSISPQRIYIIENLQTFLSFEDLPSSVAIMGMGFSVQRLLNSPWIKHSNCFYWGDIDTHGYAILDLARQIIPDLKSVLMDRTTLLRFKDLWSREEKQYVPNQLPSLTASEFEVFKELKNQSWGTNVRLEQERIFWNHAWNVVEESGI